MESLCSWGDRLLHHMIELVRRRVHGIAMMPTTLWPQLVLAIECALIIGMAGIDNSRILRSKGRGGRWTKVHCRDPIHDPCNYYHLLWWCEGFGEVRVPLTMVCSSAGATTGVRRAIAVWRSGSSGWRRTQGWWSLRTRAGMHTLPRATRRSPRLLPSSACSGSDRVHT